MDRRLAAIVLLAVTAIALFAPLQWNGGDAIDGTGFVLMIPNTGVEEELPLEITNGDEYSFSIYYINKSEHPLDVDIGYTNSHREIDLTEKISGFMLMPEGDFESKDIFRQTVTVRVDEICPSYYEAEINIYITVTDLDDASQLHYSPKVIVNVYSSYDSSGSYNKFFGIFPNNCLPPLNSSVFPFAVTMISVVIIALLLSLFIVPLIAKKLDTYTRGNDGKRLRKLLTSMVLLCVIMIFISPGLEILGTELSLLVLVTQISRSLLIVVAAVAIWKIYTMVVEGMLAKHRGEDNSAIDLSMLPLFYMLGRIAIWVVAAALILAIFGVDLQGILISAGVISLGITLGAQNILSQFFSGLVLLSTRPFDSGDTLVINGQVLRVKKVKIMFTEFTSRHNDRTIIMPNNAVTAATIVNYDKEDQGYYLRVSIPVPYGTDLRKAMDIIKKVASECSGVISDPEDNRNTVRLTEFQDSGMLLDLAVFAEDYGSSFQTASDLRVNMYESLKDAGIEVPFNRLEVTMLNDYFDLDRERPNHGAAEGS